MTNPLHPADGSDEQVAVKQKIADILGLETDPDGNPYYLLTRDYGGTIVEGVNYSDVVSEIVEYIATAKTEAAREALEDVLKNSSGGGSWRRVIMTKLERLESARPATGEQKGQPQ